MKGRIEIEKDIKINCSGYCLFYLFCIILCNSRWRCRRPMGQIDEMGKEIEVRI